MDKSKVIKEIKAELADQKKSIKSNDFDQRDMIINSLDVIKYDDPEKDELFFENPEKNSFWRIYHWLRVTADDSIVGNHCNSLKKHAFYEWIAEYYDKLCVLNILYSMYGSTILSNKVEVGDVIMKKNDYYVVTSLTKKSMMLNKLEIRNVVNNSGVTGDFQFTFYDLNFYEAEGKRMKIDNADLFMNENYHNRIKPIDAKYFVVRRDLDIAKKKKR